MTSVFALALLGVAALLQAPTLVNSQIHAFMAARDSNLAAGSDNPLPFTNVTLDNYDVFSLTTNSFTVAQSGLYWIHFSVGMIERTMVRVSLQGVQGRTPEVLRMFDNFKAGSPISTSRDEFVQLNAGDVLWLETDSQLWSDPEGLQTSFFGFRISDISNPFIAFHVGLSASLTVNEHFWVPFDITLLDTDNGWDLARRTYAAPTAGIYVLSMNSVALPNDDLSMSMSVGYADTILDISYHTGQLTLSRSAITYLNRGQEVYCYVASALPNSVYSDVNLQSSFMGFLYAPFDRFQPVAWSVARSTASYITGLADPLPFNAGAINVNSGYSFTTHQFTAPTAGVYFVHFGAVAFYYSGKMDLMLNGIQIAAANFQPFIATDAAFSFYRSTIVRLAVGDTLHIRLPAGYGFYTTDFHGPRFSGLLLSAE